MNSDSRVFRAFYIPLPASIKIFSGGNPNFTPLRQTTILTGAVCRGFKLFPSEVSRRL
ncbi:hypothetical protein Hdeb2414_s0009g00315201 [Helianthus debilis subsp. tardiflorus]